MIYFIACIVVLCTITFIIRKAADSGEKPPWPVEVKNTKEEEKQHYALPLVK